MAAVFGAGLQGRLQLQALSLVRTIREAVSGRAISPRPNGCAGPDPATGLSGSWGTVAGSHVIVTTTPAHQPILSVAWLEPGQRVTAIGWDAEHKNEIDRPPQRKRRTYDLSNEQSPNQLGRYVLLFANKANCWRIPACETPLGTGSS